VPSTAQYQIEKNVPVAYRQGGPGNARFPFAEMEVGDSFYIPWGDEGEKRVRGTVSNAMGAFQLRNKPKKLISRKVDDGLRVWRIA